ncbi:hypothetical protein AX14_005818 [Amanita brunnescens Koide BX004]|nr:hypothetical protein AX14_005818 [Amanita brunnescens Koide BX004]
MAEHEENGPSEMKAALSQAESSLLAIAERLSDWSRWRTLPQEFIRSFEYSQLLDKCRTDLEHILSKPAIDAALAKLTEVTNNTWSLAAILTFRVEPPLNEVNELQEQSQPVGANEESSHASRNSIQPLRIACLVLALSAFTWLHTLKLSPESHNHFQQVDKAVVAQIIQVEDVRFQTRISSPNENIPAAPEHYFGRSEITRIIIGNLTEQSSGETYKAIALSGGAGMGKSTIEAAVINSVEIDSLFGSSRHWLFYQPELDVKHMLNSLSRSLPLNTRSNDPLKDIIFYLRFNRAPIIIVFDNYTIPESTSETKFIEDAFGKLNQFPHVRMLLSTRHLPLPQSIRWLHLLVQPLSREAAMQTYKSISLYHDDQIGNLVEELGCVPFAIVVMARQGQRGAYPSELLRRLRSEQEPGLSQIDTVIRMSLTCERFTADPDAFTLLSVIAKLPKGARYDSLAQIAPNIPNPFKAVDTILGSSLASREGAFVQVHAPTRSYLSRSHILDPYYLRSLRAYYFQLCRDSGHELGTEEFKRASQVLAVERENVEAVLLEALHSDPSTEAIHAVLGYSNFLLHDFPSTKVLVKALDVIESRPSLDAHGTLLPHCLLNYGELLNRLDEYDKARKVLKRAESMWNGTSNFKELGHVHFTYGQISRVLLKRTDARKSFVKAREYFDLANDQVGVSYSLRGLALMSFYDEDLDKSVRLLKYAEQRSKGHEPGLVATAFGLAWVLRHQNATRSVELLNNAREAYTRYGARFQAALCTYQMGIALYSMKLYEKATDNLSAAYDEFNALGTYAQMGYVLVHRVELERQRGDFEEALRLNAEARSLFQQIDNYKEAARCVISRARVLSTMCQLDAARTEYRKASTLIMQLDRDLKLLHMIDQEVRSLRWMCLPAWRKLFPW